MSATIESPRISLRLVEMPSSGHPISAPPVLIASVHTVDYTCAHCGTVLMHAEAGQVHGLLIHCTECGSFNSTDL